jgi:hypothetical protein
MIERLGSDHGTLHAIVSERLLDAGDDVRLAAGPQSVGGDHVGIMSSPVANTQFAELADNGVGIGRSLISAVITFIVWF